MALIRRLSNCFNRVIPTLARCLHQEQRVDVYGLKINTVQSGDGPRGLLLLPGAIGSALTDFHKQIDELPAMLPGYKIVAWDPPGAGKSTPYVPKYCSDPFVDDANTALDLMQALNIGYFSVLGWNAGGITALVMAGRFPQFVDKVVVWGSSAFLSFKELKQLDDIRSKLIQDARGTSHMLLEKLYGQELYSKMWHKYVESVSKIIKARDGDICSTEVDCIQAPTLILHGSADPIITKDHVKYLQDHIKLSSVYEFPNGGHDIHIMHDKQFNQTVTKFLLGKNK